MQAQDLYQPEVLKLFQTYNPSPLTYKQLEQFLKQQCRNNIQNTRKFLQALEAHPLIQINFNAFCKIVRIIRKIVLALKNEEIQFVLADFVINYSHLYFPYIAHANTNLFQELLSLFEGIAIKQSADFNDHLRITVYISKKKYSQQWASRLVELINSEVLVDKKNQQVKNLKVNKFFSKFVVEHFDKLYPQLERLLVRSQLNIDVWGEFFPAISNWSGIDSFALTVIKKIKHLFQNNPQTCILIVNSLTSNLKDEKIIAQVIQLLSYLIGNEHNSKKKIVYISMLDGVINTLKQLTDQKTRSNFAQEILQAIAISLIKFTEEEEFYLIVAIIDQILPLVVNPNDGVAKTLKLYLKNQNKYILTLVGLILSGIYNKKEHIDTLPSVKQIYTQFKAQLPAALKKIQVNWQWLMPTICFLSFSDIQVIDNLTGDFPVFRAACLSLTKLEMKVSLKLITKKIEHLKSEEEELPDNLFVISALVLQEVKERQSWNQFIRNLNPEEIISLVARGIFPLTLFNCADSKKNKGNQFNSLLLFISKQLKNKKVIVESGLDFNKLIVCFSKIRNEILSSFSTNNVDEANLSIEKYVNSSLLDVENDEQELLSKRERQIIQIITRSLLIYKQDYLVKLFQPFTNEINYKINLQFYIDFEAKMLESVNLVKKELQELKQPLVEKLLHKAEEAKRKRVYIGTILQVKMMSEQQVKEEKYRKHFLQMFTLFQNIVNKFLQTMNNHVLLNNLWQVNLKNIIAITKFPEHRLSVQKLVNRSFIFTALQNKKEKQSKLFAKHADFLGEFFAFRNSGITPSVKSMNQCEVFLKELLTYPFQEQNNNFVMIQDLKNQFVMHFVNEMCECLLENMQFDANLKKLAIKFYYKCNQKQISFNNEEALFTYVVQNINILPNSQNIQPVLLYLLKKVQHKRYKQLFTDILNFIQPTKKLILQTISMVDQQYKPEFQEYIKIKILALQYNEEISKLATALLTQQKDIKNSIITFDMKNFVRKNSKETIEKLCIFIKEQITPENTVAVFNMVIKASEQLFDEGFDQQGLQMFPYFLSININHINENLFKPVFQLLVAKFTAKQQFGTLTKLSVEVGIDIIKQNAKVYAQKLLLILEDFINKLSGVSNIIFLGVLAPYLQGNKNLEIIERRITELFKSNKQNDQRAISKCMPDLMSFFKQPVETINEIYSKISSYQEYVQLGQAYLFSGLLKGLGYQQTQKYVDKIISNTYITKTKPEKSGRIYFIHALIQNFGRVVQIKAIKIIEILIGYMADGSEEIRNLAKKAGQSLIVKISSFSVKILLPQLLIGLEQEQNWRVKISYIWILGIMANCSAKQLQTSLPVIVPTLSTCLSNAHPIIREKASEALNLIGQTIKNPEISQCVDTLIEALQNPFEKSERAIDILLKTNFNHYIDPPSLSMIIPILDYCMRGRVSELKAGACQVIGSIVELVSNPYDLLPYLRIITTGLKTALCDPLQQIRRIASMAIGKISTKIGIKEAEKYFTFVLDIIQSPLSNTTERQGAAQAHAEIICSHTFEYFEQSLYRIFEKLNSVKHSQKEGYILVFLYVPSIRTLQFEGFIKEVNENMYCFVSDEDQSIRNSAMLVEKVLINNYCLSHTDLLLDPLCDGIFEANWKKRNAAIILIGELINIIKNHMYNTRNNEKSYAYYRGLMAVYIIKDDQLQMTRATANHVWNTYIENTPKTIKLGINELVKMWTKWTHAAGGVVFKNIIAFSSKYGQNYFTEILDNLPTFLDNPEHQIGVFEVLSQFIKRLNNQFLSKQSYKQLIRNLFSEHLFVISENVRPYLAKSLALYVDKMHQERYFENLLYPTIQKMDQTEQSNSAYTYNLHLLKDLLDTHSNNVVDRVISKIMEAPMSQFKIEVITNNAGRLANYLYSHFKRPATQVLVDEIYTLVGDKKKQNRFNLIIYCLEQVSLKLNGKYKKDFIKMINTNICKGISVYNEDHSNSKNLTTLLTFVNMLLFFLNSTPLSEIQDLDTIVGQLSPLIFFKQQKLRSLGHKIYLLIISDHKSQNTSEYIRQMIVSFQNNLTEGQSIWADEIILKDYVSILVKGIAYGREDIMEESLQMIEFLIKHTPRDLVQKYIVKIVGPIIRICNYPLLQKQKIRIMNVLVHILKQQYKIDAYNNQILSVCLRLLQQFKNSEDMMRTIADTYFSLLNSTVLKKELLLSILSKLKLFGATLIHSFYYLIKSIITERIQLPATLHEKIFEEVTAILLQNQGKIPVKGLYYASKISARLGVYLDKPLNRIESQLTGLLCPYEIMTNYLHFAYYKKIKILRMNAIEIFLKQSNREKTYYLLKSLKLCIKNSEQSQKLYTQEYLKKIIPESIIGFEQISEIIEDFDTEFVEQIAEGEINQS